MTDIVSPFDRLLPHDLSAEMCLLASMMLDRDCVAAVAQVVGDRDAFYQPDHATIYDALLRLHEQDRPTDAVLVRDELKRRGVFEEVGGAEYLGRLLNTVPSAAHAEHYARIVREKADHRAAIAVGNEIVRRSYAGHERPEDIRAEVMEKLSRIERRRSGAEVIGLDELLAQVYDGMFRAKRPRLPSSLRKVQEIVGGYGYGENWIVAALTSVGKSTFAKQELAAWALSGTPVGLLSLEEPKELIAEKLLASFSDVAADKIRRGSAAVGESDLAAIVRGIAKLAEANLHIVECGADVGEIVRQSRMLKARFGVEALCVDHLHLMRDPSSRDNYREVSVCSKRVRELYRELDVVGLTCAQLNREAVRNGRPRKHHLRDSGSVEQDAHGIILIHREDFLHIGEVNYAPTHAAEIIVDKNRGGRCGMCEVGWDGPHQRFTDEVRIDFSF